MIIINQKKNLQKKTIGCETHLKLHTILENNKEIPYLIEFWDISGGKSYRNFIDLYTKKQLNEFKAIFYIFDLTNLKSLFHFHTWISFLFDSKKNNQDFNYGWDVPFLIIANKIDLIELNDIEKNKVNSFFSNIFNCNTGENIIYFQSLENEILGQFIEKKIINLFINEICKENEKSIKNPFFYQNHNHLEESSGEVMMKKKTQKFTINTSSLINKLKLKIIDKSNLNTFTQKFRFYMWEKIILFKEKLKIFISKKKRKNPLKIV